MNQSPDPSAAAAAGIVGLLLFFWIGAILVGIALTVFWIVELIDVARREFRDPNTKIIWLLVVFFSHTIGALVYYFAGKSQGWLPGEAPLYPPQMPPAGYYPPPGQYPPPPNYPPNYPPSSTPPENRQE